MKWHKVTAGEYHSDDGRFIIKRENNTDWVVLDTNTPNKKYYDFTKRDCEYLVYRIVKGDI